MSGGRVKRYSVWPGFPSAAISATPRGLPLVDHALEQVQKYPQPRSRELWWVDRFLWRPRVMRPTDPARRQLGESSPQESDPLAKPRQPSTVDPATAR